MFEKIRAFFHFTKGEQNALVILCFVFAGIWTGWYYRYYVKSVPEFNHDEYTAFREEVEKYFDDTQSTSPSPEENIITPYADAVYGHKGDINTETKSIEYFKFDPNDLDRNGWEKLGLKSYVIDNILNYRASGGRFCSKSDLGKIYALKKEDVKRLKPWVRISNENQCFTASNDQEENKSDLKVCINAGDSLELRQVSGIGPVFSRRIVRYRNLIGGFYKREQLLDVFGIDEEVYEAVSPYLVIRDSSIRKININIANEQNLAYHPYIDDHLARLIVNFRNQHGPYARPEDLKSIEVISEEKYRRVRPYLITEPAS